MDSLTPNEGVHSGYADGSPVPVHRTLLRRSTATGERSGSCGSEHLNDKRTIFRSHLVKGSRTLKHAKQMKLLITSCLPSKHHIFTSTGLREKRQTYSELLRSGCLWPSTAPQTPLTWGRRSARTGTSRTKKLLLLQLKSKTIATKSQQAANNKTGQNRFPKRFVTFTFAQKKA